LIKEYQNKPLINLIESINSITEMPNGPEHEFLQMGLTSIFRGKPLCHSINILEQLK